MEHVADIQADTDIGQPENQAGKEASVAKARPSKSRKTKSANTNRIDTRKMHNRKTDQKNIKKKLVSKKPAHKNNIIIRLAKPQNLEPARAIARALHEKTVFAHIPWSDRKFERQFAEVLKLPPNKAGLVAERNGKVLGFAYLACGDYFAGEGHVITTIQALAIDDDNLMPPSIVKTYLRLIKGAKKWAETRGEKGKSEMVLINVTTGVKLRETDQLLRLAGANCVGGGYVV